MQCPRCRSETLIGWGRTGAGRRRRRCKDCGATVAEPRPKSPIHPMRIPFERAVLCLHLLVEGNSVRATERITGTHRDTICRLLVLAGGKAERLLAELVRDVPVASVEADELWAFVRMQQKTKDRRGIEDPEVGDSHTFLGLDADSRLILAHHVGQRTGRHADAFSEKLDRATGGRFRYRAPRSVAAARTVVHGTADRDGGSTRHAERLSLDVRMKNRRFARRTNAFSKSFRSHRASVALTVAHYNLCTMHRTIRMTPAMKAGLTHRIWSVGDLLAA